MGTYLESLQEIEKKAKVSEWPKWKKQSINTMRFGEPFVLDGTKEELEIRKNWEQDKIIEK